MPFKKSFLFQPEWMAAILITAAAVVFHLYYWLHIGGLWRDEVNFVNVSAGHSFAEFERDAFPVLMPFLVHVWLAAGLGHTDLTLRFLGLLVGIGILSALWISMWKIRRAPPLCGLVLIGLNSTVIFFGDSLRAYGLGSLCAVALTASGFLFLKQPSRSRALWLGALAVLSVQVVYHNVVVVAAVCFGAWAACLRQKNWRAALQIFFIAVLSAASLLPYSHNFVSSGGASLVFRTGLKMVRFYSSYLDTLDFPIGGYLYVWAILTAAIVFQACLGFRRKLASPDETHRLFTAEDLNLFAAVTLVFLAVGFPIFFWRAQMPMQSWYLLPLMASSVVCFDAVLADFRGILLRALYLGFVGGTAVASIFATGGIIGRHFSDVDIYSRTLMTNAAPKDYIVVFPWTCGITFNHYYQGTTPWDTLPPLSDHSIHRNDLVVLQMQNKDAMVPVFSQISQTLQSGHRVWILTATSMEIPPPGTPALQTLPPPPLKYFGWSDSPYSEVWASQTLHFIANHSDKFQNFKYLFTTGYIIENMNLFVASGWNTNTPAR